MRVSEIVKSFTTMPAWQQTLWVVWLILGLLLLVLSLNTHREDSSEAQDTRLARIEQSLASLTALVNDLHHRLGHEVIGALVLPEPSAEKSFGWPTAVRNTAGEHATPETVAKLFQVVTDQTALVNAVLSGTARVRIRLGGPGQSSDRVKSKTPHEIDLEVQNQTDHPATFTIPKGQVFENAEPHTEVQNLVISEDATVVVPAHATQTARLPAFCLNRQLSTPTGQPANVTPLRVRFAFSDQNSLWQGVASVVQPSKVKKE